MAVCHSCGSSHLDFLETRGGLCRSCAGMVKQGGHGAAGVSAAKARRASEFAAAKVEQGMPILYLLAVISFGAAALGILIGIIEDALWLVLVSISAAISGVLFLALNRIIKALEAIRDALTLAKAPAGQKSEG